VLCVRFTDAALATFSPEERSAITTIATEAERAARAHLPMVDCLHLSVEPSEATLTTGDNATTIAPDALRWTVNPQLDIARVAQEHLAQAFAHEAFHAARFRRLGEEAGARSWTEIAIGEGLATAYARDYASADEPWAAYNEAVIGSWTDELFNQPVDTITLRHWKFQHPDGREWIAYRVGTWLVDTATRLTGCDVADLVWVPAVDILRAASPTRL
jgi:uncharacterized protein YjaZ